MLQSPNGSELFDHTYRFTLEEPSQVGEARRFVVNLCHALEFDEVQMGRVSIIVNELGNNLVKYAQRGQLLVRILSTPSAGIEIISLDNGPGLDTSQVMTDGFTTGTTPGTGLGAVRRLSHEFDIFSQSPQGTAVLSRVFAAGSLDPKTRPAYEYGVVNVPLAHEHVCGDGWLLKTYGQELQILVVDGLGHGPSAHQAAREAVDVFGQLPQSADSEQALKQIHDRLKSTRGGAVFLLKIGTDAVEFTGAGNVRAVIQSFATSKTLISQNGTAGLQIRATRALTQKFDPGENLLFILHTDGINNRWNFLPYPNLFHKHPALIAAIFYRDFSRGTDDATIFLIRKVDWA